MSASRRYIWAMMRILALTLLLAATPALADEPADDLTGGQRLLDRGARLLLRGLLSEMAPTIETMEGLAAFLGDLDQYYPPERLPNGDIILRRKVPLIPGPPVAPEGDIDL